MQGYSEGATISTIFQALETPFYQTLVQGIVQTLFARALKTQLWYATFYRETTKSETLRIYFWLMVNWYTVDSLPSVYTEHVAV